MCYLCISVPYFQIVAFVMARLLKIMLESYEPSLLTVSRAFLDLLLF